MRQRRSIRPVKFPRSAPFAGAKRWPMAPQLGGCVVVVGAAPRGVRRVDRGGQRTEHFTEAALALTQRGLRSQAVGNLDDVVGRGRLADRGQRPFKFTLQKSERLFHGPRSTRSTHWPSLLTAKHLSLPSANAPAGHWLLASAQIFGHSYGYH